MTKKSLLLKTNGKPDGFALFGLAAGFVAITAALFLAASLMTMWVFHILHNSFDSFQAPGYVESMAITLAVAWFGTLFNNGFSLKVKSE